MLNRMKLIFLALFVCMMSCANDSTKPSAPIAFTKNAIFTQVVNGTTSYVYVPNSYDSSHNTPTTLFVWLHGCGGYAKNDAGMVSYMPDQKWISLAVGGREGSCWSGVGTDGGKILAAIADLKTHFNINAQKVIIGGYSSGGDIGYPLLFQNAKLFAGGIFENTGPSDSAMNDAKNAAWKVNIAHMSHVSDNVYPIANIRNKMNTLKSMGFPVNFSERAGTHWDQDNGAYGTTYDLRSFLLPLLNTNDWKAPGGAPAVDSGASDSAPPLADAGMVDSSSSVADADATVPVDASVPMVDAASSTEITLWARTQTFEQDASHVCQYFFVKNTMSVAQSWSTIYVNSREGKLRNFWFLNTNQKVGTKGSIKFTPKDGKDGVGSIGAHAEYNVGGACFEMPSRTGEVPIISGVVH